MTVALELDASISGDDAISGLAEIAGIFGGYCTPDNNGQPCIDRMEALYEQTASLEADAQYCPEDPSTSTSCPGQCAVYVGAMSNALGCCLPTIFNTIFSSGLTTNVTAAQLDNFFASCGHPVGAPCSGTLVTITIVINNLLFSYYVQNKPALDAAIEHDLGVYFQVSSSAITATGTPIGNITQSLAFRTQAAPSGSVTTSYSITPQTASQGASIQSSFGSGAAAGAVIPLPSMASVSLLARVNPAEPITVSLQGSSAAVTHVGAASHASPANALFAAVAAITVVVLV